MEERKKILELLESGKISAEDAVKLLEALNKSYARNIHAHPHWGPMFIKRGFGRHHPCCHPPHKKVIVKMRGKCCPDPEDAESTAFGCCD